jgi:hypothetical protein
MAIIITLLCVLFFINHFIYLSYNTFDYSYNMKVNIITGVIILPTRYTINYSRLFMPINWFSFFYFFLFSLLICSVTGGRRNWLAHLVFIPNKEEIVCVENDGFRAACTSVRDTRSVRLPTYFMDFRCAFTLALIVCSHYDFILQVSLHGSQDYGNLFLITNKLSLI